MSFLQSSLHFLGLLFLQLWTPFPAFTNSKKAFRWLVEYVVAYPSWAVLSFGWHIAWKLHKFSCNAYIRKEEDSLSLILIFTLKVEKDKQIKPKESRKQEIIIWAEINKIRKLIKPKVGFGFINLLKINKIDKLLTRLLRKTLITSIRNERGNVTADPTKIKGH